MGKIGRNILDIYVYTYIKLRKHVLYTACFFFESYTLLVYYLMLIECNLVRLKYYKYPDRVDIPEVDRIVRAHSKKIFKQNLNAKKGQIN